MSNLSVNIKGLKELGQAMNSLERKVRNSIGVKAMRKGGAVIKNQARANAPVLEHSVSHRKRGTLKKAISASTKIGENGSVTTKIFVRKLKISKITAFKSNGKNSSANPDDPYYWRFVEFGTSKMPAKPFLRPAFTAKKEQASREIIMTLQDEILRGGRK